MNPPNSNQVVPSSPNNRTANDNGVRAVQQQQQIEVAQQQSYKPQIPRLIGKRFLVGAKLGSGSFGTIHAGKIISNNQEVAIKFEEVKCKFPQLLAESRIYKILWGLPVSTSRKTLSAASAALNTSIDTASLHVNHGNSPNSTGIGTSKSQEVLSVTQHHQEEATVIGIPKLYWYGVEDDFNVMVIECLGPSLEDLFSFCSRRFSLKTVLILADQLISRIEFLHYKHFIHRDGKFFLVTSSNPTP
ncbi:predicted protein [Naegleria gruberi]|uniref:Predicted protein n=1 Tax=Naegleria gruberi TaxID=5762 RepID=D2V783_NAEGR|nr:uncharacterized protein NAEGRDRAFT_64704 [Naegleria gruberi]EFC47327.1 predicted protein [Naegleria gruberi]|eukprot:XP_002680071.1 predicted protein [Naegleria gruberi strain NEG-M]